MSFASFHSAPPAGTETIRTAIVAADDLSPIVLGIAITIVLASLVLLVLEVRRAREARRPRVIITGLIAALATMVAIVRPQRLRAREVSIAPRVVVVLDRSRSMALSATDRVDGTARIEVAEAVARALRLKGGGRVDVVALGTTYGVRDAMLDVPNRTILARADGAGSDLGSALRAITDRHDDPPASIVVISDGRLELGDLVERKLGPTIHAVAVADGALPDAAVRAVRLAGAAVAHQQLPLRVEVACTGGLSCGDITVTVRELREIEKDGTAETILATGTATVREGSATIELPITLERAGTRTIEISIAAPKGDAIPENDRRLLTIDVARERVRILHIAGRPTYDVRALRTWLKSDAAIDVVSFFILRTPGDDVGAPDEELALIPFPVRELFTEALPTFDAVLFQDFDADPYQLTPHLPAIAKYVEQGGGLVHIGGPNAFSAGGYAGSPLARVTPVDIPKLEANGQPADVAPFVPNVTAVAHGAPILAELEALLGDDLPEFGGTSVLGDVRPGGIALWTHPRRLTPKGKPMPVLAIGDVKDGRSIALGIDSTRNLAFSAAAARNGGRGYDALWRGLLGWLMRDPRYEPVRARLVHASGSPPCLAGADASLRLEASPVVGPARLRATITALDPPHAEGTESLPSTLDTKIEGTPPILIPLGVAPAGGWAMRLAVSERDTGGPSSSVPSALATRTLSVCERGGDEWADPRPDRPKLEALVKANGGIVVSANDIANIPAPKAETVSIERSVYPILPAWSWASIAALALGLHWFTRRRGGLA